jgi:type IV pilus assembly protein PilW
VNIKTRAYCAGFTLMELMVSMVIGLFLVGGVATLAFHSKKAYETQNYVTRLQENARFAIQFLSYDLRMAGYFGCSDVAGATGLQAQSPGSYGDIVQFSYANPDQVIKLTSDAGPGATTLIVSSVTNLVQNQGIAVSDCGTTDVVQITNININTTTLNVDPPLSRAYTIDKTEIRPTDNYTYQVKKNGAVPSLVRTVAGVEQEMVEGVEYLRLLYGEDTDTDGTPDAYLPQDQVSDWTAVKSIKIGLLLRSVSNWNPDDNPDREYGPDAASGPYDILDLTGGNAVNPPQGSLRVQRRVFVNTAFVRNQT